MNEDDLDAFLRGETDDFYPGSRHRRRTQIVPAKTQVDEDAWDAKPITKTMKGREIEFFEIGDLSNALGRPVATLRRWERMGYIPTAPYRSRGRDGNGNRLYSRALVETTVAAFAKRGLMDKPRLDWNRHGDLSIELFDAWSKIHASETA